MKTLTVKKINLTNDSSHLEIHKIQFPNYKDKGWYRMMASYSAFFEGTKRRNRSNKFLYYLDIHNSDMPKSDYEIERDAKLPVIYHDGLYEFFDYIGYDRKRKKIIDKY